MATDRSGFDVDNRSSLFVLSNDGLRNPVSLWADPTTHALVVNASVSLAKDNIPASGLTQAVAVQIVDGSGNQIASFGGGTQYTDGGTPPAHPIGGTLEFNNAGTWATVGSATPLPVTATFSPSGTQDINLKQVGGSTFALGQQVAAASLPIVLTAAQITTLTPPAAITNYALETGGNLALIKTDVDNLNLAQGSATSSQAGPLMQAAVTTGSPSYTTAQTSPLSLTTNGRLRTDISGVNGNTTLSGNGVTGNGSLRVTIASDNTAFSVNATQSGTWTNTVTQATGTNLHTVVDSGTVTATPAALPSTEVNGQTTGTTAGTAVQLASNALVNGVIVQALSTNATSVYVGTSSVSSSNGFELQPGQATSVGVSNTNAVWIVSATNGDKVCWIGS